MRVTADFSDFMIEKGQIGDQIQDHNRGELRCHPEAFSGDGFEDKHRETSEFPNNPPLDGSDFLEKTGRQSFNPPLALQLNDRSNPQWKSRES
jgi:hypothetical protein